jgi:hypothetical protein
MPIDIDSLNIETVKQLNEDSPKIKLRYCRGERGWASDIGDGLAIIDNIPAMTQRIGIWDVVRVIDDNGDPAAGEVVWRAYDATSWVNYPCETEDQARAWYKSLREAVTKYGLCVEGMVPGIAAVEHGKDVVLREILHAEGVDLREVRINTGIRTEHKDENRAVYTQGIGPSGEYHGSYDVVHHGYKTVDEVLAMVRAIPVPSAEEMDSPDPAQPGHDKRCPPAVGFDESEPVVCGNACRISTGKYVLLRGGVGADVTDTHEVELEQIETWVREKFDEQR